MGTELLQAPGSRGRLNWYIEKADYNVASFRYRCLLPAHFLESHGHFSHFFRNVQSPDEVGASIFVKAFGDGHLELARELYRRRRPIILDLCDNIFADGYRSKLKYLNTGNFLEMAKIADAVVVSSEALARVLNRSLPETRPAVVIPDPALSQSHHQALQQWSVALQRMARLPANGGAQRSIGNAFDAFRGSIEKLMGPAPADPRTHKKVIWFGKHGTRHSSGGMSSLTDVFPALEALNKKQPLELVVISNNRRKYEAHFGRLPFACRYRGWSNEAVYEEIQGAAAFVMPNASDEFSACKSANRAVLALASGVPVIASWLESLAPLRDVIVLDDWTLGLERYLLHSAARDEDVTRAAKLIEAVFSPAAQGCAWLNLLGTSVANRDAAE